MISCREGVRIFIHIVPIDMRKSIDGLSAQVIDHFGKDPQSGDIYLFRNKSGDKVKALYWDRNGFVMHYKRLERARFKFPRMLANNDFEITEEQLRWLFAGLDFMLMKSFPELKFSSYF